MSILTASNHLRFTIAGLFALLLIAVLATPAMAQENDSPFGKEEAEKIMETQFFMSQLMMLGHDEGLRNELEVVDEQVDDLKELAKNYQKDMMSFYSDNKELLEGMQKSALGDNPEDAQEMVKKFQKKNAEFSQGYMDKLEEVLFPHQIERLKQIAKQQQMKLTNKYSDEFGIAASLSKELGLTAEQEEQLNETIKDARQEYYDTVETAKKKALDRIMGTLTPEQKEKMEEIIGDDFDQDFMRRKNREKAKKRRKKLREEKAELQE